jgi:WXG100 family type VII secretion target
MPCGPNPDPDPGLLLAIRYETLDQAKNDLAVAYESVQRVITDLKKALDYNLGEWSDHAKDVYAEVQTQWLNATNDMQAVLQKANVHLGNTSEMYQAMERQNVSIWTAG